VKGVIARKVISIKELSNTRFSEILCYPRYEHEEFEKRLMEMEKLGVQNLEFFGDKKIFDIPVLGKGCVGIVLTAHTRRGKAALKIRRLDANRKEMFHEGKMLKRANKINVGPELFQKTENFILMELIEGDHFPKWFESLKENVKLRGRLTIIDILEQCYRLDQSGLDHGELSKAPKHIIVDANDVPHLIDFETASIDRRVSNVTCICQYLFLGSQIAKKVKYKLGKINEKKLIDALRKYKQKRTRKNFEKILEKIP
jgi:putative serine/threonine protein kinase